MVKENSTLNDGHTMQCTDDVSCNCTLNTYIVRCNLNKFNEKITIIITFFCHRTVTGTHTHTAAKECSYNQQFS